jgi:hypothetical protein
VVIITASSYFIPSFLVLGSISRSIADKYP